MDDPNTEDDRNTISSGDGFEELRKLLLGTDKDDIEKLRERLDNPKRYAQDVSRILPDAVILRSSQDKQLTKALMPTVEEAIGTSIKRNPQRLVDIIFPVIGPAIRKAVSQAFSQMLQSLNDVLAQSVSIRSIRWRIEALRTGKSFVEVVLSRTLIFSVEQLFLIHKKTGLLLQHVASKTAASQQSDMISSMLTAIQDFIQDSFDIPKGEGLELLQVGEFSVWIEQGPYAVLAAIVRGNAPKELRIILQDALENIHLDQGEVLDQFQGDTTPFTRSLPYLESCLIVRLQDRRRAPLPRKKKLLLFWSVLLVLILAIGIWLFFSIRDSSRWSEYVNRLKAQPGIMVVSGEKRDGKYFISGFRDPLAIDPHSILRALKIDSQEVAEKWEPFQSSHADFVLMRAKNLLRPPGTVSLRFEAGTLLASGLTSQDWVTAARKQAPNIPGVSRYEDDALVDFYSLKSHIENQSFLFSTGSADIADPQNNTTERLVTSVQKLCASAGVTGRVVRLKILGHTDRTGAERTNVSLSQKRAESAMSLLLSRGLKADNLKMSAVGTTGYLAKGLPAQDRISKRSVSFKVDVMDEKSGNQ